MKAVFTSLGSMGDIQPIFALAVEMARSGHDVTVCVSPNYRDRADTLGLRFIPLGPVMRAGEVKSVIEEQTALASAADQARLFIATIGPHIGGMFRQLCDICRGADVLISTPHQVAARMVHDATGIRFVTVHLAHFGALGAQDMKAATAPMINQYRELEGLAPLYDPLTADAASPQLALYAVTSRILKRPRSWPPHHRVTGYFFLDEGDWPPSRRGCAQVSALRLAKADAARAGIPIFPPLSKGRVEVGSVWTPPHGLVEFLASGSAPVVISFSSMMHSDAASMTDLLLTAVQDAEVRAIILDGWSGLARNTALPAGVYALTGFVPHCWLFPRASCVVHHGGAGTTAAVFRAGVPAVVVPHILDQPIWAEFARAMRCAGAVIPIRQLTSDKLAAALTATLKSSEVKASCERMAADIAAESGVQTARGLIEDLVGSVH